MSRGFLVPILLPADPANPLEAATKQYVDAAGGSVTGTKLSALASITGALLATLDVIEVVDVSDTTMAASGTNKKITLTELVNYLNTVISAPAPADNSITNAKLADMATLTLKGNNTGSTADPIDLTVAQAKTLLAITEADVTNLVTDLAAKQPLDADLTTIAGLTATTDNVLQSAAGAWASRTPADLKTTLAIASGDVSGLGALATKSSVATADVANDAIDNTKLANSPANTLKGNNTGSTADPLDLSVAQVKTLLAVLDNAGPMFNFSWDTTTTAGTSTNGLRANNATLASATALYINYTPKSGVDLKTRLLAGTAGDRVYIQDRINSVNYRTYELTGAPTDNTTYATLPVVHRAGGGSFSNGLDILAGFTPPPITVGTTAPTSPLTNDLWIDTT